MSETRQPRGLYGITPDWADTPRMLEAIGQAARGGMQMLQWRRKEGQAQAMREQAHAVQALCRELGVFFIVNDDWQLGQQLRADGIHLGREDGDLRRVRDALGATQIRLGVSCYDSLERAQDLLDQGADYVAFGAVFPSGTKPAAVRAPLSLLGQARALVRAQPHPRPTVVAIGGITVDNAAEVVASGADSIAVIGGLFLADDIEAAARHFSGLFSGRAQV